MKFKKVLVVESCKKTKEHLMAAEKLKSVLKNVDPSFSWVFHEDLKKSMLKGVDLIITLGGDGTFIEAANLVEDSFILGVNSHPSTSEGALTTVDGKGLEKLKKVLLGDFKTVKIQRARIKINDKVLDEYATNEVYVGSLNQFHCSRYFINHCGVEEEQRSSGVIVSTGAGSKAWFKSAGGKEFGHGEKKLKFVVREPYFGKRVYVPTILKGEVLPGEKLCFKSNRDFGGVLAVGFKKYEFNKGDVAEVKLSDNPLKVVVLK